MQQNFRQELEDRRNLVGDALGGMIVPGVQRQQFLPAHGVTKIKFVRTDDVAFRADAEQLGFERIEVEPG